MGERVHGSYAELANEYYNSAYHPTCANFRDASASILKTWLPEHWQDREWICEVGAGRSLVAETASQLKLKNQHLVLLDSASEMMMHSHSALDSGCRGVLADARALPFVDNGLALVVSILGDPYNTPSFWREVSRVLSPNGNVIFTTPAFAWSSVFRRNESQMQSYAEFKTTNGSQLLVPSFICSEKEQVAMMESCGLRIKESTDISVDQLNSSNISRKLEGADNDIVVTGYLATVA